MMVGCRCVLRFLGKLCSNRLSTNQWCSNSRVSVSISRWCSNSRVSVSISRWCSNEIRPFASQLCYTNIGLCQWCSKDIRPLASQLWSTSFTGSKTYDSSRRVELGQSQMCLKSINLCLNRRYSTDRVTCNTMDTNSDEKGRLIKQHTLMSRDHMTPEIAMHLITKDCPLWTAKVEDVAPFPDPFWAFYWPGGQVLTRYILDNPGVFRGQTVLDVGSGCGASAIAAAMVGADRVIANDVDPYSARAIELNASENKVRPTVDIDTRNLIGRLNSQWTTILLGDMFYDPDFRDSLVDWLKHHRRAFNSDVFIGDPGRLPLMEDPIRNQLTQVAEYDLTDVCKEENNGLTKGYVWKLK